MLIILWVSEQSKNIYLLFLYIGSQLEIWLELYPQRYSQETLFIPILFIQNIIHSTTIIENMNIIHNILAIVRTGTIHYSYMYHFLPTL